MLRRRSGARFPFLRRRISPSPTRHRNPDRPRPERVGPGIRLRADRDAGLELRLGRRGGPRLGFRPDGPARPGVRRGADPAGRGALLSDLRERYGPIHPDGLPERVPPERKNLLGIETAAAHVTSRTITGSPGTASAYIRGKRIFWSLLGGHFESPWPGTAEPYFCPGREAGCENYLVGFPAKSLTFILLSVPSPEGAGYAREVLKELIGDVYSPWGWLEYE